MMNGHTRQTESSSLYDERNSPEEQQRRRSRWVTAIETFSPIWFALVMNTGIISLQLHQLPYQFNGLGVISTILFVAALAQFVVYILIHLARLIFFPRSAYLQTISDHEQACLWGCCPIALLTLTSQIASTASSARWGYDSFAVVAYVCWWVATLGMLCSAMIVYIFLCKSRTAIDNKITAAIFIPAVGTTTNALVGGLITNYGEGLSARLAVPVIITSYVLLGFGMFIAMCIYTLFLFTLLNNGMYMPPAKFPGLLLLVGPFGQTAAALSALAAATEKNFGTYMKGTFITQQATVSISASSTVLSLMLTGFSLFWLMFGLYFIMEGAIRRQIPFTMTWWSTIFPTATLVTTWIQYSIVMDSPAFRVLATALLLILIIDFIVCAMLMLWGIWKGTILDGREQLAQLAKKRS